MTNIIDFEESKVAPVVEPKVQCSFCRTPIKKGKPVLNNGVTGKEMRCICPTCMVRCRKLLDEAEKTVV